MHNFGHTRSCNQRDHLLQTPDTFVRMPLPVLTNAAAIVHTGAAAGAAFTQYTVEFEEAGALASNALQRFVFVMEGDLELRTDAHTEVLRAGGYAYLPASHRHVFTAGGKARAAVIERHAGAVEPSAETGLLVSREEAVPGIALMGDPDLQVRSLLPEVPGLNFAVNTMTYQPGAALPQVEIHVMEHGLLMLEGGGIYRLGDRWYPVYAGDFIWMAPFCPQWFGAIGKQPAKYLIYKDWNQHPLL